MENQKTLFAREQVNKQVNNINDWFNRATKRLFDIIVSIFVLIFTSPFWALIAIAIKRDSPGPVFYRGRRMGMGGKPFQILKFRTMYETPQSYAGPKVTAQGDERITPLGHWLRDTKINEFPQFINVLKGEMSLVGPRPEDPEIATTWPRDAWTEILSVRPGITSPASVQYRNEEALLSINGMNQYFEDVGPDKRRLDQIYVRHRSFLMDMDTMFWTFILILPLISMQAPPENLLFVGPFTRIIRRYLRWYMVDMVLSFIAIGLCGVVLRATGPLDVGVQNSLVHALLFSIIFSLVGSLFGANKIKWSKATFKDGLDLIPAWVVATIIVFLSNAILLPLPSVLILAASVLSLCAFFVVRFRRQLFAELIRWSMRRKAISVAGRERVMIVGSGAIAHHASWLLEQPAYARKYWVVGFIDDDLFRQGMRIYGVPVLGGLKDIPELVNKYDVGLIILADYRIGVNNSKPVIDTCNQTGAKLLVIPDFYPAFNKLMGMRPEVQSANGASLNEMNCLKCMTKYGVKNTGSLAGKLPADH